MGFIDLYLNNDRGRGPFVEENIRLNEQGVIERAPVQNSPELICLAHYRVSS